jgi:hypothetical protein
MNIITRISATPETNTGRERSCVQCDTTYKSKRSTSNYCSTSCRQKGNRGTPSKVTKATQWSMITKALHKVGYIGVSGPASTRSTAPTTYSLTVSPEHAHSELSYHFNRKGWGCVTEEEFSKALRTDGIESFYTLSPEALAAKQWRDRNTQRLQYLNGHRPV